MCMAHWKERQEHFLKDSPQHQERQVAEHVLTLALFRSDITKNKKKTEIAMIKQKLPMNRWLEVNF